MENHSPYDDIPEDLAYRPAELEETAFEVERLTRMLFQESLEVLRRNAVEQTARSSAREVEMEARLALRDLLEDPDELDALEATEAPQDIAWQKSLEGALSQGLERSLQDENPEWLTVRANDLARTMAVALVGFGADDTVRSDVVRQLLSGDDGRGLQRHLEDIQRRYELSGSEMGSYLKRSMDLLGECATGAASAGAYAHAYAQTYVR